jgi:hypothetical protein
VNDGERTDPKDIREFEYDDKTPYEVFGKNLNREADFLHVGYHQEEQQGRNVGSIRDLKDVVTLLLGGDHDDASKIFTNIGSSSDNQLNEEQSEKLTLIQDEKFQSLDELVHQITVVTYTMNRVWEHADLSIAIKNSMKAEMAAAINDIIGLKASIIATWNGIENNSEIADNIIDLLADEGNFYNSITELCNSLIVLGTSLADAATFFYEDLAKDLREHINALQNASSATKTPPSE